MSKLKVGIDINEVLRSRWIQFDRFYVQEFGEEGIPNDNPYVYDFFEGGYKWEDSVEVINELKEPEDMPDDINPKNYQVDDNGEALADYLLFKPAKKVNITAKESYNRFMYEDFLFEIRGAAPKMYQQLDLDVNNFLLKYNDFAEFTVMSVENKFSIPPTLFFLSKISSRFENYKFLNNSIDMWKNIDILITTDPKIIELGVPWGKKLIKLNRPYNEKCKDGTINVLQIADLIENKKFEKLMKYNKI